MTDHIPTLKTITLRTRPLTTHSLAWSSDAELAVAADESLHIFLPEFPAGPAANGETTPREQFFTVKRRIPIPASLNPRINAQIVEEGQVAAAAAEEEDEEDEEGNDRVEDAVRETEAETEVEGPKEAKSSRRKGDTQSYGVGTVTGFGGALNQVVTMSWSPSSLGVNGRPILSVLLTCGAILVYGEAETVSSEDQGRERSFERWQILWGIGGPLPGVGWQDCVRGVAWAREVMWGRGMLAYRTEERVVVVVGVGRKGDRLGDWRVGEVGTFHAEGPHDMVDVYAPDYVPSSTPFDLKWTPWITKETPFGSEMSAILGYMAPNYIGFRRITIRSWPANGDPIVEIEDTDVEGICMHLGTDAFFEFEEGPYRETAAGNIYRGIIATPLQARPFEVLVSDSHDNKEMMVRHHTKDCNTVYPSTDPSSSGPSHNPITGLLIHPSTFSSSLQYTLTRLSATVTTPWLQTTLATPPQWATDLTRLITLQLPLSLATATRSILSDSDSATSFSDASDDSDSDGNLTVDAAMQINPNRVRIWAVAGSPGSGSSAVLYSRYATMFPDRPQRSKVAFGWVSRLDDNDKGGEEEEEEEEEVGRVGPLSAEGRAWEWMYGGGPPVCGFSGPLMVPKPQQSEEGARGLLAKVVDSHDCVFCSSGLWWTSEGFYECNKGHSFAGCTSSGLPILTPGISRVCGLCRRRCMKPDELAKQLRHYCGEDVEIPPVARLCGACGGKFIK